MQAERALHREIIYRLGLAGYPVLPISVPNGIWIPARTEGERAVVARIINRLKSDGMLTPGAPDLILGLRGGSMAMVELKRPKSRDLLGTHAAGRPSEAQQQMAERAAFLGIAHAFVSSWDELRERLVEWGVA